MKFKKLSHVELKKKLQLEWSTKDYQFGTLDSEQDFKPKRAVQDRHNRTDRKEKRREHFVTKRKKRASECNKDKPRKHTKYRMNIVHADDEKS